LAKANKNIAIYFLPPAKAGGNSLPQASACRLKIKKTKIGFSQIKMEENNSKEQNIQKEVIAPDKTTMPETQIIT
jgi:hypothetical protein